MSQFSLPRRLCLCAALVAGLSACGETIGEQALAGSAIGAGLAVVGDGTVSKGIAIGAASNIAYCQRNPGRCRGY